MDIPYEKAFELLRSWSEAKPRPRLTADFRVSALANAHVLVEEVELSEDTATLWFGRVAWGNGSINLPLRSARFRLLTPADKPPEITSQTDKLVVRWLEMRFPNGGEESGCLITEFISDCTVFIAGLGPFGIVIKSSEDTKTP